MKMNDKGFAISGILYTILIIFMVSMITLLFNLQNRKTILDELKADTVDAVESDNNYEYLLNEINTLKANNQPTDITPLVTFNNLADFTLVASQSSVIKVGNVVYISLVYTPVTGTSFNIDKVIFANIPEGYRPSSITALNAAFVSNIPSDNIPLDMTVRLDGNIQTAVWGTRTINSAAGKSYIQISGSYVINT